MAYEFISNFFIFTHIICFFSYNFFSHIIWYYGQGIKFLVCFRTSLANMLEMWDLYQLHSPKALQTDWNLLKESDIFKSCFFVRLTKKWLLPEIAISLFRPNQTKFLILGSKKSIASAKLNPQTWGIVSPAQPA